MYNVPSGWHSFKSTTEFLIGFLDNWSTHVTDVSKSRVFPSPFGIVPVYKSDDIIENAH